jgi:hypothetical protein
MTILLGLSSILTFVGMLYSNWDFFSYRLPLWASLFVGFLLAVALNVFSHSAASNDPVSAAEDTDETLKEALLLIDEQDGILKENTHTINQAMNAYKWVSWCFCHFEGFLEEPEGIYQTIMDCLISTIKHHRDLNPRMAIWVENEEEPGMLKCLAAYRHSPQVKQRRPRIHESSAGLAWLTKKEYYVPDTYDPQYVFERYEYREDPEFRSLLCVPILCEKGKETVRIGVLSITGIPKDAYNEENPESKAVRDRVTLWSGILFPLIYRHLEEIERRACKTTNIRG